MSVFDGWDFVRGSPAYNMVSGVLILEPANTPRFDASGLIVEPERTNKFRRSNDFAAVEWSKIGLSVTPNSATAPDATVTADKLVATSGSGTKRLEQAVACQAGEPQSVSIFVKAIPGQTRWLFFRLVDGTAPSVWFDLINGTVGITASGWSEAKIEALADGWYRVSATFVATSSSQVVRIGPSDSGTVTTFTGDGIKGLYAWGAQWEAAATSTSFIETTSATASRAAEKITRSWTPEASGYLYIEFVNPPLDSQAIVEVISADVGLPIFVAAGAVGSSNGDEAIQTGRVLQGNSDTRAVFTWGLSGRKICASGSLASDANDPGPITVLTSGTFGGYPTVIKDVALVDGQELTDDECYEMTGPKVLTPLSASALLLSGGASVTPTTLKTLSGTFGFDERFYAGRQGSDGFAPGAGVLGVRNATGTDALELTYYQYGGTLKQSGQIFEFFINSDLTGIADLSLRGVVEHNGSRFNCRNGADTASMSLGYIGGRLGVYSHGDTTAMAQNMLIGHARNDGAFSFVTGLDPVLDGGTEVARIGLDGLQLKQRGTDPVPPVGHTVIWAKTDGSVQKTSNINGVISTAPL